MKPSRILRLKPAVLLLSLTFAVNLPLSAAAGEKVAKTPGSLNVLFIGNSYTARHNLANVVKAMAETGNPGLEMRVETVIYGGRRLVDHWRLGSANFVRLHELTAAEEEATIAGLEAMVAKDPEDSHAKSALAKHRAFLPKLEEQRKTWDVVVLQSYRDDLDGDASLYAEYAPKFAELAHAQGARVILYETTPTTQNQKPLTEAPDPAPVMEKEKAIARLANRVEAEVAPMALIALKCQTQRPDFTLRFINDAHLNHTMAYLTACAIYAAIFDRSPEGLPVDSITDIRFFHDTDRDKDRDGNPITRTFSEKDRADLQRFVREGREAFEALREKEK